MKTVIYTTFFPDKKQGPPSQPPPSPPAPPYPFAKPNEQERRAFWCAVFVKVCSREEGTLAAKGFADSALEKLDSTFSCHSTPK